MSFFIGIDVSTTATKTLLMDDRGKVIAVASIEYDFDTPHPLWSEQNPDLWWKGTVVGIRQVLSESEIDPSSVRGIGLTGQMHGLVLLDEKGQVIRPAILWNDQRTGDQCDEIRKRLGKKQLIEITGNDALTGFTAPKILWIQEQEPDAWNETRQILLPKDYVRYRLTGEYGTDKAGGAGTLLFDVKKRDWSERVLELLDIPADYLPKTHEGPEITGLVTKEASNLTGLPVGTPVVAGGGDQAAQAVGVGAVVLERWCQESLL
jgi:xylulokinase